MPTVKVMVRDTQPVYSNPKGPGRGGVRGPRRRFEQAATCSWCGGHYARKQGNRLGLPTYCSGAHRTASWRAKRDNPDAYWKAWQTPAVPMRETYLQAVKDNAQVQAQLSAAPQGTLERRRNLRQVREQEDARRFQALTAGDVVQLTAEDPLTPEELERAREDPEYAEWLRRLGRL